MNRFWNRDRGLRELEGELHARRSDPPETFLRAQVARVRGDVRRHRPRALVVVAAALVCFAFIAAASAGGFGSAASSVSSVVHVFKRIAQPAAAPTAVLESPAKKQYKKKCGSLPYKKCNINLTQRRQVIKEGNSGFTKVTFNVKLNKPSDGTVSVDWSTADGSATSSGPHPDYVAASGTITFSDGQQNGSFTVDVIGDTIREHKENFFVNLSNPVNGVIIHGQGRIVILNDDKKDDSGGTAVGVNDGGTAAGGNGGGSAAGGSGTGAGSTGSSGPANGGVTSGGVTSGGVTAGAAG